MKLSPNLRKPTKEYKDAFLSEEETKTAWSCEVRQLKSILDMVKDPDAGADGFLEEEDEEDHI